MDTYLLVLSFLVILNFIPFRCDIRRNIILSISFLVLFCFIGFRYNYGVDYKTYENLFYNPDFYTRNANREFLFWLIFRFFSQYYQFVLFQSFCICATYFYMIRKYVVPQFYSLFFLVFMTFPGFMFETISAERSSLCAVVCIWGIELFYLKQNLPLYLIITIFIASLFHNSSVLLLLFPLLFAKWNFINFKYRLIMICICLYFSTTAISNLLQMSFGWIDNDYSSLYSNYIGNKFSNSTFSIVILRSCLIIPFYFLNNKRIICQFESYKKFGSLSFFLLLLICLGIDFQYRMSMCLFIFYFIYLCLGIEKTKRIEMRCLFLFVLLFYSIWNAYVIFSNMRGLSPSSGSFWFYNSIFDLNYLP